MNGREGWPECPGARGHSGGPLAALRGSGSPHGHSPPGPRGEGRGSAGRPGEGGSGHGAPRPPAPPRGPSRRAGDSPPRACPRSPPRTARPPSPSPESLPRPRPSPLIGGRSRRDFSTLGWGCGGQRSGDGGRGAPPRARVRPRLGGPVTQPRRLSRNRARGASGAGGERSGREGAAPSPGGRGARGTKPFPAREAPRPRGTGSGRLLGGPAAWSAAGRPEPAAGCGPTPSQLAAGDLFELKLLAYVLLKKKKETQRARRRRDLPLVEKVANLETC